MPDTPSLTPNGDSPAPGAFNADAGQIVELDIRRELQDSYLTYAMSTIMDRALPDVRDGLKPSQRRILVAMNDLRLFPGSDHGPRAPWQIWNRQVAMWDFLKRNL